ncbi:MAG: hypothetical protein E7161_00295 [Firmicutes bacterium]|nr:hypothetical protein [Bacillota bacterium]
MKQAVATTSIFKVVLVFTLLFSAFLAVAITYNRVYKLKNETIAIVEKYEGISRKSLTIINNYLQNSGYDTVGKCENGEYGITDLSSDTYELSQNNKDYYYCLNFFCQGSSCNVNDSSTPNGNQIFYNVKFFFKFNIPFIGELFTFNINGNTKGIKLYSETQKLS